MPSEIATLRAALRTNPEQHAKLRQLAESGVIQPGENAEAEVDAIVAAPEHFGIEGAKPALCECGTVVWLSPSTQAMIIARGAVPQLTIMCVFCFAKAISEEKRSKEGM